MNGRLGRMIRGDKKIERISTRNDNGQGEAMVRQEFFRFLGWLNDGGTREVLSTGFVRLAEFCVMVSGTVVRAVRAQG